MKSTWKAIFGSALSLMLASALTEAHAARFVLFHGPADTLVTLAQARKKSEARLRKEQFKCHKACSLRCEGKNRPAACTQKCKLRC